MAKKKVSDAEKVARELLKTLDLMKEVKPVSNDMEGLCFNYLAQFKRAGFGGVKGGIPAVAVCANRIIRERDLKELNFERKLLKMAEKRL